MLEVAEQRPTNNEHANSWISKLSPVTLNNGVKLWIVLWKSDFSSLIGLFHKITIHRDGCKTSIVECSLGKLLNSPNARPPPPEKLRKISIWTTNICLCKVTMNESMVFDSDCLENFTLNRSKPQKTQMYGVTPMEFYSFRKARNYTSTPMNGYKIKKPIVKVMFRLFELLYMIYVRLLCKM